MECDWSSDVCSSDLEPLAFAVRYDSQDLLEVLNLFFHNAALDGRLEQNLNYWVNTIDWKKDH
jgi:polar amino acid transport system substrate-binding protein